LTNEVYDKEERGGIGAYQKLENRLKFQSKPKNPEKSLKTEKLPRIV